MNEETAALVAELRTLVERPVSPWMDPHEVADYLTLSVKSIQNMTGPQSKNPIPFCRLSEGGAKRFHRQQVDEWLLTAKSSNVTLVSSQTGRHRANGPPQDTGGKSDPSSER
jgi:hypothetical protein